MTFYDFLITYYLSENSPLGDLAHDVQLDGNFPTESKSEDEIRDYFSNIGTPGFQEDLDEALGEFSKLQ
ncbi:YozE family protein [Listeria monocytogenes]|nr:hypothetical protein [Listeria monocytogenes]EAH0394202.1 hypothetical protein [Listeria monocytogenes]EAH3424818.1 hypothetical protein [Listeria monocytogenes]EDN8477092.1 hypothetical protein [Listeria monocytogenes]EDN8483124.1 hypothetical protein [Listeria monocytogenes]